MIIGLLCGAAAMAVAGLVLILVSSSRKGKLAQIQGTETSSAADLAAVRDQVERDIGKGAFMQRAEVKGKAESDSPLAAEFSGSPCVAYAIKLERQYEETRWETDSEGRRTQRTSRGSEILAQSERRSPFWLRDSSGRVRVIPDGAELVMERSVSRFEPEASGRTLSLGAFVFDLSRAVLGAGRRTLGYTYQEDLIPLGRELYVLGEAASADGDLAIRRPSTKGERFIVSVKSEEELSAGLGKVVAGTRIASIVTFAIAAGLLVAGIIAALA